MTIRSAWAVAAEPLALAETTTFFFTRFFGPGLGKSSFLVTVLGFVGVLASAFSEILRLAFRSNYIDTLEHPVLRRLRGEV